MPYGDRQPTELLMDDKAWRAEPARVATEMGHDVECDPPAALTAAGRWTCKACGRAVLVRGTNIYGSAGTTQCTGRPYWED